jgi:hypothetical protein
MARTQCAATVTGLAFAFAALSAAGEPRPSQAEPSAARDGRDIRLAPSGVTFRVPQVWLDYQAKFGKNLHLTRAQLDKVKDGEWEWDTEYAAVANAALPFDRCAAHVGSEGWGRAGTSFGDLQVRAYVVPDPADKVAAGVSKAGLAAAARYDKRARAEGGRAGDWHRATVRYDVWYGDYGGTAVVDVYARPAGAGTAVFVFMHAEALDHADTIADILKSVGPAGGK